MKTGFKVYDIMRRKPITIDKNEFIENCAKCMEESKVGSVIVKENEALVGIITEKDIVRRVVAKGLDPKKILAKEVMSKNIIGIDPEKDVYEAIKIMGDHGIKRLPVVEDNKLVGLITFKYLIKIQPQILDILSENIKISGQQGFKGACEMCGEENNKLDIKDGKFLCNLCEKQAL